MRNVKDLKKDWESGGEVIPGRRTNTEDSLMYQMTCLVLGAISNLKCTEQGEQSDWS